MHIFSLKRSYKESLIPLLCSLGLFCKSTLDMAVEIDSLGIQSQEALSFSGFIKAKKIRILSI